MNKFQKYCVVLFTVMLVGMVAVLSFAEEAKKPPEAAPAVAAKQPSNEMVEQGWKQRCNTPKAGEKAAEKICEIFQRLEIKENHMLVAELAVGFLHDKTMEKGAAHGAIILPLGISLESDIGMKVDEGKPVVFKPRFCTAAGCFSFVTLSKDLLDTMKKGKAITFTFKTAEGQNVNLIMHIGGFEKALKENQ